MILTFSAGFLMGAAMTVMLTWLLQADAGNRALSQAQIDYWAGLLLREVRRKAADPFLTPHTEACQRVQETGGACICDGVSLRPHP